MVNQHLFPPSTAARLTPEGFRAAFRGYWSDESLKSVFKLERRQLYQEPDNPSYVAFASNDWERAMALLPEVAHEEGLRLPIPPWRHFVRTRALVNPLSDYLRWETRLYDFNALYGEHIVIVDLSDERRDTVLWHADDFVLFEDRVAFIHDYDSAGVLRGAWQVHDASLLVQYGRLAKAFLDRSTPLGVFRHETLSR